MGSREQSSRERRNQLIKQHGLDITNARDRRKIATLMQQQRKIENREIKDFGKPLKDLLN